MSIIDHLQFTHAETSHEVYSHLIITESDKSIRIIIIVIFEEARLLSMTDGFCRVCNEFVKLFRVFFIIGLYTFRSARLNKNFHQN